MLSSMTKVTRRYEWDMAHRLPFHDGKCRRLHGHRYVADVTVIGQVVPVDAAEMLPETGMVVDFGRLDDIIKPLIELLDHRTMLWQDDPLVVTLQDTESESLVVVEFTPTAENIAGSLFRTIQERLHLERLQTIVSFRVCSVRIYETPKGWAEATEG